MIVKEFKKIIKTLFKLNVIILILFPLISFAQSGGHSNITFTVKPDFPEDHQLVTVSIASYTFNLEDSNIDWYENGKIKKSGVGKTVFSFETGNLGSSDVIKVVAQKKSLYFTKTITITPADLNLTWEAETYTPPFYKGKALNSYQSRLRVVALPNFIRSNGSRVPASDIIYKWQEGWKILGDKSGYGKNILILDDNKLPGNKTIILEAKTVDNKLSANAIITIKNTQPQVILYNKDPLFGIEYNKALLNQINLPEKEITIIGEPFFFSNEDIKKNIKYKWSLNNKIIKKSENKTFITLRKDNKNLGSANLSLKIQNINKIMQFSEENILINFGKKVLNKLFNTSNFGF